MIIQLMLITKQVYIARGCSTREGVFFVKVRFLCLLFNIVGEIVVKSPHRP